MKFLSKFSAILMVFTLALFNIAKADTITPQQQQKAVDQIKQNVVDVINILQKDNGSNTAQVRKEAEDYAIPYFDFQRMTLLAVGLPWRSATADQKTRLTEAFKKLLIGIYSGTLVQNKDADVKVEDKPIVASNGKYLTVKSKITAKSGYMAGKTVNIDYDLYLDSTGNFKIFNVIVEGSSLVTIYRDQFKNIVDKNGGGTKGIEALIEHLEHNKIKPEQTPVEKQISQQAQKAQNAAANKDAKAASAPTPAAAAAAK